LDKKKQFQKYKKVKKIKAINYLNLQSGTYMIFDINNKNEADDYINRIFYSWKFVANPTKIHQYLLDARKVLNKEERICLYNQMAKRGRFSYYIIELNMPAWECFKTWECFKNYLLADDIELKKIENELIIKEIIL